MNAETIPHQTPADGYPAAQPDAAPRFETPKDMPAEKKNRKRKKNRRRNRSEVAAQLSPHSVEQTKPLSLEGDAVMLWHRPETSQSAESIEPPMPPPLPPDPLSYRRRFWNEQSPHAADDSEVNREVLPAIHDYKEQDSYSIPQLEAEPIHAYPASEADRQPIRVEPLSVETHQPATGAAVAAFERITRQSMAEQRDKLPRAAKAAAGKAAEAVVAKPQPIESAAPAYTRSERQLSKQELLKVSKDIKIDGIRLKDIYQANRIDEPGLRAIVDVYLRGGDVKQQLSNEIVAKEQSYERDPQLRHQRRNAEHNQGSRSSLAAEKIGKVLGQAKEIVIEQGGKLAASSQKTAKKASRVVANGAKQAQHDLIDNSNTRDWLGITAVVVVYSIILLLWLA